MTVKEMIAELKKYDENATVHYNYGVGTYFEVQYVGKSTDETANEIVIL